MTTLHKAAQAALEALDLPCDRWNATQYEAVKKARDDLRAALAQEPAQQPKPRYKLSVCTDCDGEGACRKFGYDDYTDGFCETCRGTGKEPVLAQEPAQPAVQEPATPFDDPRVQAVYEILADTDDFPPKDSQEHWEGWRARRIVDRLFAKRLTNKQIVKLFDDVDEGQEPSELMIAAGRAIEAAVLGEKP